MKNRVVEQSVARVGSQDRMTVGMVWYGGPAYKERNGDFD